MSHTMKGILIILLLTQAVCPNPYLPTAKAASATVDEIKIFVCPFSGERDLASFLTKYFCIDLLRNLESVSHKDSLKALLTPQDLSSKGFVEIETFLMRNGGQLIIWGEAESYSDGVVLEIFFSIPEYKDNRKQRLEEWTVSYKGPEGQEISVDNASIKLPRRRFRMPPIVIENSTISRLRNLESSESSESGTLIEPDVFEQNHGLVKMRLGKDNREPQNRLAGQIITFLGGIVRLLLGEYSDSRRHFVDSLENMTTSATVDGLLFWALASEKLQEDTSAEIRKAVNLNPYHKPTVVYKLKSLISRLNERDADDLDSRRLLLMQIEEDLKMYKYLFAKKDPWIEKVDGFIKFTDGEIRNNEQRSLGHHKITVQKPREPIRLPVEILYPFKDRQYRCSVDNIPIIFRSEDQSLLCSGLNLLVDNSFADLHCCSNGQHFWSELPRLMQNGEHSLQISEISTNRISQLGFKCFQAQDSKLAWNALKPERLCEWKAWSGGGYIKLLIRGTDIEEEGKALSLAFLNVDKGNYIMRNVSVGRVYSGSRFDVVPDSVVLVPFSDNPSDPVIVHKGAEVVSLAFPFEFNKKNNYIVGFNMGKGDGYVIGSLAHETLVCKGEDENVAWHNCTVRSGEELYGYLLTLSAIYVHDLSSLSPPGSPRRLRVGG